MKTDRAYRRAIAVPMSVLVLLVALPYGAVKADMVLTEALLAAPEATRAEAGDVRGELMGFLSREDVQSEMQALGVDPVEATERVRVMSDREIQLLAGRLDEAPAGGSVVGAVVGSILFVFLVLLLTDILCVTTVFPFTKCVAEIED